jgi:hypothetical protein
MTNNVLQRFKETCQIMNSEFISGLKDNIKDSYLAGSISNKERMDRINKLTKIDEICTTLKSVL